MFIDQLQIAGFIGSARDLRPSVKRRQHVQTWTGPTTREEPHVWLSSFRIFMPSSRTCPPTQESILERCFGWSRLCMSSNACVDSRQMSGTEKILLGSWTKAIVSAYQRLYIQQRNAKSRARSSVSFGYRLYMQVNMGIQVVFCFGYFGSPAGTTASLIFAEVLWLFVDSVIFLTIYTDNQAL